MPPSSPTTARSGPTAGEPGAPGAARPDHRSAYRSRTPAGPDGTATAAGCGSRPSALILRLGLVCAVLLGGGCVDCRIRGNRGVAVDLLSRLGLVLVDRLLDAPRDHRDRVAVLRRHELHAHRRAAGGPEVLVDRTAHDLPARGDREDLVALDHDERADQPAALLVGQRHRLDAEAAAALGAVLRDPGPLGEATVGDREDVLHLEVGV